MKKLILKQSHTTKKKKKTTKKKKKKQNKKKNEKAKLPRMQRVKYTADLICITFLAEPHHFNGMLLYFITKTPIQIY